MQKILLLISALVLAVSANVALALEAPEVWVKAVAEGRTAPEFDEESIAKSVLGKQLREASPEQKLAFQREFKAYITYVYSSAFVNKFKNKPAVYNVLPQPADGFYDVGSVVDGVNMKYTLKNQSGSWRLIHYEFDGVSLVNNHRTSYSQEIEKSGIDGLIKMLKDKNAASGASVAYAEKKVLAVASNQTAELADDPLVLGASASPNGAKPKGKKKK